MAVQTDIPGVPRATSHHGKYVHESRASGPQFTGWLI